MLQVVQTDDPEAGPLDGLMGVLQKLAMMPLGQQLGSGLLPSKRLIGQDQLYKGPTY